MESEATLSLPDGKTLYYVHTKAEHPNRKVIVHIHGLSGWPYEVASTAMARQFPAQGYDVVRPYLYHWLDDARVLHETTIVINAADVEVLIDQLQQSYDQIYVCGHSYGGPTAMLLRQDRLTALSLWDPSYVPAAVMGPEWTEQRAGLTLFKGYFYFLVSDELLQEGAAFDLAWARQISKDCRTPLQVVQAANGYWAKFEPAESFHSHAAGPTDFRVIEGTVHCFVEGDTTDQLLAATKDWFDRF